MNRNRARLLALVVLSCAVVGAIAAPAIVSAVERGSPNLGVYLEDEEIEPGTEETLELQIQNDAELIVGSGQHVTTARGATVEIEDAGPFEAKSGETALGPIQDGQVVEAPQRIAVPDSVEPGEYDVSVRVRYSYMEYVSERSGSSTRVSTSDRFDVTVVVPDEPRLDVTDVSTAAEPGGTSEAVLEIENTGAVPSNRTKAAVSGGNGITVDGGTAEMPTEEIIGDLEPNESTTMTVDVTIDEGVSAGDRPLEIDFSYHDEDGIERQANSVATSLSTIDQSFSIDGLESTLAVGYDGVVTGTVTNDGPRAVDDAVLTVTPQSDSLFVEDTRYALPDLKPGESTEFRYPTDVSGQADPGPRQMQFSVEYSADGSSVLEDGPMSERVVIADQHEEFSIETADADVRQGETSEVFLEITNERPETLSNIDAKLYTDSPLSAPNSDAFVNELGPGESAEIRFEIGAAPDAAIETHPIELDFEYDTERGDTVVSDFYQHPIDVGAGEDDGGNVGSIVTVMALLTVAGLGVGLWWRRT
ncbi:COG1361 S-layer family protein [Natronobacterium texcoconense]|nr:hypothetical protein [Natronobacterium texcoconense]